MKKVIYILILSLSGVLHGQSSFSDIERVDTWVLELVEYVDLNESIDMVKGKIRIDAQEGDIIGVWDASSILIERHDIESSHMLIIETDYLLQGKYFLGVKRKLSKVVKFSIDIAYSK